MTSVIFENGVPQNTKQNRIILQHNLPYLVDYFGISQKRLAYELGVTEKTIYRLLNKKSFVTGPMYIAMYMIFTKLAIDDLDSGITRKDQKRISDVVNMFAYRVHSMMLDDKDCWQVFFKKEDL